MGNNSPRSVVRNCIYLPRTKQNKAWSKPLVRVLRAPGGIHRLASIFHSNWSRTRRREKFKYAIEKKFLIAYSFHMITYERAQKATLIERLNEQPQRLIIVTGPRQVGKSTLVQQVLAHEGRTHRYLSVDEPDSTTFRADSQLPAIGNVRGEPSAAKGGSRDARWLAFEWERAREVLNTSENGFVLVFDEIQKIPNWSETVKGLWDADRRLGIPLHVVLLGSAPLLMQSGLGESLAGRFETVKLTHWSFAEMSAAFDFDLDSYIYFGGYPGTASMVRDEDRWREHVLEALVEPNIERDILAMQRVDKPALLKRLFAVGAQYSSQILSYNKLCGQLDDAGNTTTLVRYLELLSRAGLLTAIPAYRGGAYRRRHSTPKLGVLNTALMSAQSTYSFAQARSDRSFWGRLVESSVGAHLFNNLPRGVGLYYWRDGNHEVDFVLERGGRLVAIEVKSGSGPTKARGLPRFEERFDTHRSLVVGADGVPLAEFLSSSPSRWFESP